MAKEKVLIVDDDPFILDILKASLEDFYQVYMAEDGEEALKKIKEINPGLVILDYKMPKKDGIEVCREIRNDPLFLHLPIIMLTGKGETQDKIKGLDSGADDYIVKPFEPQELLARARMVIKRSSRDLDANPLTRLPGNVSIITEITNRLQNKEEFATLYIDLDKFKAFNDYYGFEKGDSLIKETARIIIEGIQKHGTPNDFIGHIGGDDFVAITEIPIAENMANFIIHSFDRKIPGFYETKDRTQGFILTKNRQGQMQQFPFVSISIGIVESRNNFQHVGEIAEVGAELKHLAKQTPGSKFVKERRKQI